MLLLRIIRSDDLHVRVIEHGHDADLAPNANQVLLVLDGTLLNELHCHLQMHVHGGSTVFSSSPLAPPYGRTPATPCRRYPSRASS